MHQEYPEVSDSITGVAGQVWCTTVKEKEDALLLWRAFSKLVTSEKPEVRSDTEEKGLGSFQKNKQLCVWCFVSVMYVWCHMNTSCLQRPGEVIGSPGTGFIDSGKSPCGC